LRENDKLIRINNIDLSTINPTDLVNIIGKETDFEIDLERDNKLISLEEIVNLELNLLENGVVFTPYSYCVPKLCPGGKSPCDKCATGFGLECCDVCADAGCFLGTCGIRPNTYSCCLNTSLCDY
jgi:hypothetical protein